MGILLVFWGAGHITRPGGRGQSVREVSRNSVSFTIRRLRTARRATARVCARPGPTGPRRRQAARPGGSPPYSSAGSVSKRSPIAVRFWNPAQ